MVAQFFRSRPIDGRSLATIDPTGREISQGIGQIAQAYAQRQMRDQEMQQMERQKMEQYAMRREAQVYGMALAAKTPEERMAIINDAIPNFDSETQYEMADWIDLPIDAQNMRAAQALTDAGYGQLIPQSIFDGPGKASSVKGVEGDFTFKDEAGNIFSQQTYLDTGTMTSTPRLTDITGRGAQPVGQLTPVSKLGLTSSEEIKAEVDRAKAIQKAKNLAETSFAADKETQKALGELRGDINRDETQAWRLARGQQKQLNQLENALKAASTGRYSQLKTFAGQYLPGVDPSDEQALQSIVTSYALEELQKQSGPKTDFDFVKAAETQIQLGNTKKANEIILKRLKDNADYAEARWKAYKDFKNKNKNVEDFEDSFEYDYDAGMTVDDVKPEAKSSIDEEYEALRAEFGIGD